jgi:hypothetical protein
MMGNPEAEATLQRQPGLVLPNAAAFTDTTARGVWRRLRLIGNA